MSVFVRPSRPPRAFQVHRQLESPRVSKGDIPPQGISNLEKTMNSPQAPIPAINTGKSNKFTAKSPLVTTMGSSEVK